MKLILQQTADRQVTFKWIKSAPCLSEDAIIYTERDKQREMREREKAETSKR